jgi:hypothetical protein
VPVSGDPIVAFAVVLGVPAELVLAPSRANEGATTVQIYRRLAPVPNTCGPAYTVLAAIAPPLCNAAPLMEA